MIFRSVFPNIGEVILILSTISIWEIVTESTFFFFFDVCNGIENAIKVHDKSTWHVLYDGQNTMAVRRFNVYIPDTRPSPHETEMNHYIQQFHPFPLQNSEDTSQCWFKTPLQGCSFDLLTFWELILSLLRRILTLWIENVFGGDEARLKRDYWKPVCQAMNEFWNE